MAVKGKPVYWTPKRLKALQRLAEVGDTGNATINWEFASNKRPKDREILKERENYQLSKTWGRYKRVLNGICYKCDRKRDTEALLCNKCRKEITKYHKRSKRFFVRKEECINNKAEIRSFVDKRTKKELVEFITDNINSFTVAQKIILLDDYIEERMESESA
ncbi:MAG: hypothetical protein SVR08_01635 [Spirochaetota bacterium]|nr:hypothetical protein [Spirochaetota bacterium]